MGGAALSAGPTNLGIFWLVGRGMFATNRHEEEQTARAEKSEEEEQATDSASMRATPGRGDAGTRRKGCW